MGASFDNSPVIKHEYLVRMPYRREAVSDHERRASAHDPFKSSLDQDFRLGVHVRGCLIEDEDAGVLQDCPGQ